MFRRIAALCGLVGCLGALLVAHGSIGADGEAFTHPTAGDLATDYGDLVGQRVLVVGHVVSVDPVFIDASLPGSPLSLRIDGLDLDVAPGDRIQVFGVAQPDATIQTINAVRAGNRLYAWSISAVAVAWVTIRVFRQWTFDLRAISLRPRSRAGRGGEEGESTDA